MHMVRAPPYHCANSSSAGDTPEAQVPQRRSVSCMICVTLRRCVNACCRVAYSHFTSLILTSPHLTSAHLTSAHLNYLNYPNASLFAAEKPAFEDAEATLLLLAMRVMNLCECVMCDAYANVGVECGCRACWRYEECECGMCNVECGMRNAECAIGWM